MAIKVVTSLGRNLEDLQHFLRDTSNQIGLSRLDYGVTASSKVDAVNLTIAFVPGMWYRSDVLKIWEQLVKVSQRKT